MSAKIYKPLWLKRDTFTDELYKRGKFNKDWKERFFAVYRLEHKIEYYASSNDRKQRNNKCGSIDLRTVSKVEVIDDDFQIYTQSRRPLTNHIGYNSKTQSDKPFTFQLITNNRTYIFAAYTKQDCLKWLKYLQSCLYGDIIKEGWLQKQGQMNKKKWKNRYVVLNSYQQIKYYDDQNKTLCRETIDFKNIERIDYKYNPNVLKYTIEIEVKLIYKFDIYKFKIYNFAAQSRAEQSEWKKLIDIMRYKDWKQQLEKINLSESHDSKQDDCVEQLTIYKRPKDDIDSTDDEQQPPPENIHNKDIDSDSNSVNQSENDSEKKECSVDVLKRKLSGLIDITNSKFMTIKNDKAAVKRAKEYAKFAMFCVVKYESLKLEYHDHHVAYEFECDELWKIYEESDNHKEKQKAERQVQYLTMRIFAEPDGEIGKAFDLWRNYYISKLGYSIENWFSNIGKDFTAILREESEDNDEDSMELNNVMTELEQKLDAIENDRKKVKKPVDDGLGKYRRLIQIGVPKFAISDKMRLDGLNDSTIKQFIGDIGGGGNDDSDSGGGNDDSDSDFYKKQTVKKETVKRGKQRRLSKQLYLASYCSAQCGFGHRAKDCGKCGKSFISLKVKAYLCTGCGFGHKGKKCIKCGKHLMGRSVQAYLCSGCGFGHKGKKCVKCGAHIFGIS